MALQVWLVHSDWLILIQTQDHVWTQQQGLNLTLTQCELIRTSNHEKEMDAAAAAGKWTLRLHCWCRASSATLSKEKRAGFSDPLWSSAAVWPAPAATEGSLFVTSSDLPVSRTSSEQGEKGAKRRRAHSQHKHAVWRGTTLRNVIDRSASNVPVFGNICVERKKKKVRKKWDKT